MLEYKEGDVIEALRNMPGFEEMLIDMATNPQKLIPPGQLLTENPESFYSGMTSALLKMREKLDR